MSAGAGELVLLDAGDSVIETVTGLTTISSSSYTTTASNIIKISIGTGITSLSVAAFQNCTGLTTVTFEGTSNVATIDAAAFKGCTALTSITLPNSVTTLETQAFNGCSELTSVTLPTNNNFTSLSDQVFQACDKLTSITIPANVTTIGAGTFMLSGLTSFTIPNTVTTMTGINLFRDCTALASVTIGTNSSVTTLPNGMFQRCRALQNVTIPSNITTIGNSVFDGCTSTSFTSITIPDSVTSLGTSVFNGCTSLDTVVIGSELTSIGATTFNGCTKLSRVTMGDKVGTSGGSIANDAFTNAGSATGVILKIKMSATALSNLGVSYATGVTFYSATNVSIVADFVTPAPLPPDASCFPGNTPVQTDQGIVNICDLCPDKHTIRGNKIETVTQNTGIEDFLILIKKDTLYPNVPSQDTYTTFDHNIFVNKQNVRAGVLEMNAQDSGIPDLMNRVCQVPYNGEVLYNVLLKDNKHDYMCVNNLIVETMNPKNIFAKYYCYLQNKKQGEKNSELEKAYEKYISKCRSLVKKHKRSRLTKK